MIQVNVRATVDERDRWAEQARWDKKSLSRWVRDTLNEACDPDHQVVVDGVPLPPEVARLFSDDRNFNLLEWVTDVPGQGETTITLGAKVRASTVQMVERILMDSRCPYSTKSDYLKDAILCLAYIIAKGRFLDEEVSEWAAQQRAYAKAQQILGLRISQQGYLSEMRAFLDGRGVGDLGERAVDVFTRMSRLLRKKGNFEGMTKEAWDLTRRAYSLCRADDKVALKEEFSDIIERMDDDATTERS